METIVIGKPSINIYLPLQEFPQEGDIFYIDNKTETVGGVSATAACLLGKWGMSVHYTGVVGDDGFAEKLREDFKTNRVEHKYLETNFEVGTACNYIILNAKTGFNTKILYNNTKANLEKYKYDFIPDWAVLDGTDPAGTLALLNTNATVKTVFYARRADKDTLTMCKKCTWVVCTENFCRNLTKSEPDGSAEGYVDFYQRVVDAVGSSNYIIILDNKKILYCEDGRVKILPEMKMLSIDVSSFDSIFTGAFTFGIMNNVSLDDSIKLANVSAGLSLAKVGEVSAIPEIDDVLDNSGLREKLGVGARKTPTNEVKWEGDINYAPPEVRAQIEAQQAAQAAQAQGVPAETAHAQPVTNEAQAAGDGFFGGGEQQTTNTTQSV